MGTSASALAAAQKAVNQAKDFTRSVNKVAPKPAPYAAPKPAHEFSSAPYSIAAQAKKKASDLVDASGDTAAGIHEVQKNVKQYEDVYGKQ